MFYSGSKQAGKINHNEIRPKRSKFDLNILEHAFFQNISNIESRDVPLYERLAHLMSTAIAEKKLREEAAAGKNPEAAKLLTQLKALKALKECEADIL